MLINGAGNGFLRPNMPGNKLIEDAVRYVLATTNDRETLLEMLGRAGIPHLLEDAGAITIDAPGKRYVYVAFDFSDDGALKRVGVWSD